jgi:hypothetical protein
MSEKEDDCTSSSSDEETPSLCTFAATGANPAFQAIFVCLDCSSSDDDCGACLCHACAELCHAGHDVDYIAMGPAYCDCQTTVGGTCCRLQEASQKEAKRISVPSEGMKEHFVAPPLSREEDSFVQEAFTISSLDNDQYCDLLVREATELIKHTKDTHWLNLSSTKPDDDNKYSKLEELALTILRRHVKAYQLCNDGSSEFHGGAEWWVQVKPVTFPSESDDESRLDHVTEGNEAVDLHFDKDEALAESFDLGSFPTLSTVTYLTATPNASPTVLFPHTYDKDEGEVMDEMLVSYPKRGKHIVFDGRLLHGAPAHHALRQIKDDASIERSSESTLNRVTFLVNVWVDRQPSGVKVLPSLTRQLVRTAGKRKKLPNIRQQQKAITEFESKPIETIHLENEDDLPESIRGRIELPFVSKGATWISNVGGNGLVLVTFPPPPTEEDTVRVKFGPGLQAYLEYQSPDYGGKEHVIMGDQVEYI